MRKKEKHTKLMENLEVTNVEEETKVEKKTQEILPKPEMLPPKAQLKEFQYKKKKVKRTRKSRNKLIYQISFQRQL